MTDEGNQALQEFLAARNPRQQHSSTLESYLIKPIQRILKYPLLLQQLRNLTDPQSDQHLHLVGEYFNHLTSTFWVNLLARQSPDYMPLAIIILCMFCWNTFKSVSNPDIHWDKIWFYFYLVLAINKPELSTFLRVK